MNSGKRTVTSRTEMVERLANVMQASRTIRSEVALTIWESSEMRVASRQLRMESLRMTAHSTASRRNLHTLKAEQRRWLAQTIAHLLSSRGYSTFVAEPTQDTASVQ